MNNDNRSFYKFNWWNGFLMKTNNRFIEYCIGLAICFISFGVSSYMFLKAIAPNGLLH